MNEITKQSVPKSALILGYLGLIPFIVLSISLWIVQVEYYVTVENALLTYAAIILSFMGAIYWGAAINNSANPEKTLLILGVIPALIAWFASLAGPLIQYSVFYIAFSGLCVIDSFTVKNGALPSWYPRLRIPLTIVVILCLISAQLANVFT